MYISPKNQIPNNFDWIGYYCYSDLQECTSYRTWFGWKKFRSAKQVHYSLRGRLSRSDQKMFIIGPSFTRLDKNTIDPKKTNARLEELYRIAAGDEKVILFSSFLWRSYYEGQGKDAKVYRGAREEPLLKEFNTLLGDSIINGKVPTESEVNPYIR